MIEPSLRSGAVPGESPAPRIAVLGLGNVLMGDDALGPTVVRRLLATHTFPADVVVQDVGTPGLDLTPFVSGLDVVIFVDTVKSDGPPGALRSYRRDDILRDPPPHRVSPHDPGLKETLLTLEFAGSAPREVLLVGLVPADTSMHAALSDAIRAGLPAVEEAVLRELDRLGAPAVARPDPLRPDLWWEEA